MNFMRTKNSTTKRVQYLLATIDIVTALLTIVATTSFLSSLYAGQIPVSLRLYLFKNSIFVISAY